MKKRIFLLLIAATLFFGIIPAYCADVSNNAAEYMPDAALYISSDSTDKYNEYQTVTDKHFGEIDAYRKLNDFKIFQNHTFSSKGLVFDSQGEIIIDKELSKDYIMNIGLTANSGSRTRIIWSMQDSENYACLEVDGGSMQLIAVKNSAESILASYKCGDIFDKLIELKFEIENQRINVHCKTEETFDGIFENIKIPFEGGKTGIRFTSGGGSVKLVQLWQKNAECYGGVIDGCLVSYENLGKCTVVAAFYDKGCLSGLYLTKENIINEGNNYFSINVNNTHSLQGLQRKYFVFDSLNNIVPLVKQSDVSSYRSGNLSDELEPYYPHTTAQTRTTTEMVKRIRGGKKAGAALADENLVADELPGGERYEVVDMYKKAGIDLSIGVESYSINSTLKNNMPQRFSHLTPKSLTGTYDQPYSVDAPWNNKIPVDNPSMPLASWNNMNMTMQIGTVKNKINNDGNGIGIPIIIGEGSDPEYTLLCKWETNSTNFRGYLINAPENVADYTNSETNSDNHAVFINDETKTSLQTMGIYPPGYTGGYSLDEGLVLNYDSRAQATSSEVDLSGIANEGNAGTNAISMPMEAFMIRKKELAEGGEINHAIAGAIGNMMKARVYPAISYDSWVQDATSTKNLTGNVPYGAIVRISPELPLEELYENGKLSSPAYKLLKAWRDYGFYNIDCSGSSANKLVLYTATEDSDWRYTAPYSGKSGISEIQDEIKAFLSGDAYFGLEEKPQYYLTLPIVKYTQLDVTLDGTVDEADYTEIQAALGMKAELEKSRYDVNKDGLIDENDLEIMESFLDGTAFHKDGDYTVTGKSTTGGTLWIDDTSPKHGQWISISAAPKNGYKFVGWEGEFADKTKNVIHIKADRDITVKAIYQQLDYCKFNLTIDGEGTVKGSEHKRYYTSTVQNQYRANTQMAFSATPAEGWEFDHWEYKGNHYSDVIDLVINEDIELKAVFKQPDCMEEFQGTVLSGDTWEAYSSGNNTTKADFGPSGGMLKFYDWAEKLVTVVNKNIILSEGEGFEFVTSGTITATNAGNRGIILFGYNSEKDFYSLELNSSKIFELNRTQNGKQTILKSFVIDSTVDLSKIMTFKLDYSNESGLDIKLYQGLNEYTLLENYKPDSSVTGKFGLGSKYCGAVGFDKFILYKRK